MSISPQHSELQALSDQDLVARYDAAAAHTVVGTGFYRDELARRHIARESARILELTKSMRTLTWIITALTAANVVLVAVQTLGLG